MSEPYILVFYFLAEDDTDAIDQFNMAFSVFHDVPEYELYDDTGRALARRV